MRTSPDCGSKKRSSRLKIVLLPAPDGPTMAMVSPGCGAERDAVERGQLRPARVGKAYVVELDLAAGGDGQGDGKAGELDLRLDGQQLGEALGGAGRLADLAPDFRDLREGGAGEDRVEHELAQAADGHAAVDDGGGAEPQHAGDAGDDEEHGERGEHGARAHALLGGVEGDLDVAAVLVGGGPLVRERLHGARGGEVLGGVGGSLAPAYPARGATGGAPSARRR